MPGIPRYKPHAGLVIFSAGFRPFFLAAALWAAIGIPLWLAIYSGKAELPSALAPIIWHVHEMVFGFGAAAVAGFLLTAIPNWTGRMPLQGPSLAVLVLLWAAGRAGTLLSAVIGTQIAAVVDLSFPVAFLIIVAREILAGRNWRNLPMLLALSLLLTGNLLVHLEALKIANTAELGNRIGIATLLMLISLVGGRIVPSFTRNWLVKNQPGAALPQPKEWFDQAVLGITTVALALWTVLPAAKVTASAAIIAGIAIALRLSRWQGHRTGREKLLVILHIGYGWLALGFVLLGLDNMFNFLPATAALHALTAGGVGTMILAVMTRASLGHTGRRLSAGPGTKAIYALVTLAAFLRVLSPLAGATVMPVLWAAAVCWTGAFGLFAVLYGNVLARPRIGGDAGKPI